MFAMLGGPAVGLVPLGKLHVSFEGYPRQEVQLCPTHKKESASLAQTNGTSNLHAISLMRALPTWFGKR